MNRMCGSHTDAPEVLRAIAVMPKVVFWWEIFQMSDWCYVSRAKSGSPGMSQISVPFATTITLAAKHRGQLTI